MNEASCPVLATGLQLRRREGASSVESANSIHSESTLHVPVRSGVSCYLLLIVLMVACAGQDISHTRPTMRDSAGIVIIESPAPHNQPTTFAVDAEPVLSFGRAGDEAIGAVGQTQRLRSGNVAFIDTRARELRMFVPGRGIRTVARRGGGPGEVRFPVNLQELPGDSLQVYDRRLGRVSVFTPDGNFAYDISLLHGAGRAPLNVLRVQDTLLLGQVLQYNRRTVLSGGPDANIGSTPMAFVLYGLDGGIRDTVVIIPHGSVSLEFPGTSMLPVYGGALPFEVTENGIVVLGADGHPSFTIVHLDGRTIRIQRMSRARRPIDIDSLRAILSTDRPIGGPVPSMLIEHPSLRAEFLPDSQPVYKDVRVFERDQVWLGSGEPFTIAPKWWDIVSKDGLWIGTVVLPENTLLLDVAYGHVVLRRDDELGVQYIEVYDVEDLFTATLESTNARAAWRR